MTPPSPQRYRSQGRREGVDELILDHAIAAFDRIRSVDPRITPILTLRHLSYLTDIPFLHLRDLVARRVTRPYRFFHLKKRIPGRNGVRMISVPNSKLMVLQRWIVDNILKFTRPHPASFAFHPSCRPFEAAAEHCGCSWLLKVDLKEFFHTISEGRITAVFSDLGFPRLLSFELARLVTVACDRPGKQRDSSNRWSAIPYYQCEHEGVLPQGAPTSPMLANLAMLKTDGILGELASAHGMTYTRYADDLAFSCRGSRDIQQIRKFTRLVLDRLQRSGFQPNHSKTVIRGPGTRRIVLGMLVNGQQPRLPKEYKDNIRLHLHFLNSASHGPSAHAAARGTSVSGIFHHVRGLIAWAETVEPQFGGPALECFKTVDWPPLDSQL